MHPLLTLTLLIRHWPKPLAIMAALLCVLAALLVAAWFPAPCGQNLTGRLSATRVSMTTNEQEFIVATSL